MLASGEYSPYRLFSQTKIVGSFQIAARFIASWNDPMFTVPSPKKQSETSSVPAYRAARPKPVAIGRCAPTIANEPYAPTLTSVRCIDPPLPAHRPPALPRISAKVRSSGAPIARTAPCPR